MAMQNLHKASSFPLFPGLVVYPKLETFSATSPALESDLLQNTLWPEAQKLYGHGNPIFCVASSVDGQIVASASKAAKADEASIFLWGGVERQWRHLGTIDDAHSLTVTQMAFSKTTSVSPSATQRRHRLLSVSRDRTIVLTEISLPTSADDDNVEKRILFRTNKSNGVHARIIWSCDWAHDDAFFVTVSRDKKLVAWVERNEEEDASASTSGPAFLSSSPATLPDSCTAVACAPRLFSSTSSYLIAVGLENGVIHLLTFDKAARSFSELLTIPNNVAHHLTVKRLRFRPRVGRAGDKSGSASSTLQLASCGSDGFLRVFDVEESN